MGGRGSNINDRRNWDSYLVDDEVKKIMPKQAKKMQGFPDDFEFPVPTTQAMKQLGNSVAVDAIKMCGESLVKHMEFLSNRECFMSTNRNKGEWTELYSFLKLINDKKLNLSDEKLNIKNDIEHFTVTKVTTLNIEEDCYLNNTDFVVVKNNKSGDEKKINVSDFLNTTVLNRLVNNITSGSRTFNIPEFDLIQDNLGISIIHGGNSNQKADIVLDIENNKIKR